MTVRDRQQLSIKLAQREAQQALAILAHLRHIYRTVITAERKVRRPVEMNQENLVIASGSLRILMFDDVPLLPNFAKANSLEFRATALESDLALFLLSELVPSNLHISDFFAGYLTDPVLRDQHPYDKPSQVAFVQQSAKGFEGPIAKRELWVPDPDDASMAQSWIGLGVGPSQLLNFTPRNVPLAEWGTLRIGYLKNIPIRRRSLICYVANKLGGVHYDASRLPSDPAEANEFKLLSTAYDWDNQAIMHAGFVMVGLACIELLHVPGVFELAVALGQFHEKRQARLRLKDDSQ